MRAIFVVSLLLIAAAFGRPNFSVDDYTSSIWPQPQTFTQGSTALTVDPSAFSISSSSPSPVLRDAMARYEKLIVSGTLKAIIPLTHSAGVKDHSYNAPESLTVVVTVVDSESDLQRGVDESYSLDVSSGKATIEAKTVWGALHALESLSQLVVVDSKTDTILIPNTPVHVEDFPRFSWRGVMIDTCRHFEPVASIKETVDAMAMNKFNTLHWHAVDAQSFPITVNKYPKLAGEGAYSKTAVYTQAEIADVVAYAKARGVRVILETDIPGHAYAWGYGYPEIITDCPAFVHNINNIPLNPAHNLTFQVVDALFEEMTALFTDDYYHIGGDEVVLKCWAQNEEVVKFMADKGLATTTDLWSYFEVYAIEALAKLNKVPVVWQEVFNQNVTMPEQTVVQVWKDSETLSQVIEAGFAGILSFGWYLNMVQPDPHAPVRAYSQDNWVDMYNHEPTDGLPKTAKVDELLLGGEACIWAEEVNQFNFIPQVWPRANAVAERLWSAKDVTDTDAAKPRLSTQACRMSQRGVGVPPLQPGYCPL